MTTRPAHPRWWWWVAGSVIWGLLCVGVRHRALILGHEMRDLLVRRNLELARVQMLEREVAAARQLESMERRAAAAGFVPPSAGAVVVVGEASEPGLLARWFAPAASGAAPAVEPLPIRSREEVVTRRRTLKSPAREARQEARREAVAREAREARRGAAKSASRGEARRTVRRGADFEPGGAARRKKKEAGR